MILFTYTLQFEYLKKLHNEIYGFRKMKSGIKITLYDQFRIKNNYFMIETDIILIFSRNT